MDVPTTNKIVQLFSQCPLTTRSFNQSLICIQTDPGFTVCPSGKWLTVYFHCLTFSWILYYMPNKRFSYLLFNNSFYSCFRSWCNAWISGVNVGGFFRESCIGNFLVYYCCAHSFVIILGAICKENNFSFFVWWYVNLCRFINAKAILLEEQ